VDYPDGKGPEMKCDLCPGAYRDTLTVLSFQRDGKTIVVEGVPAKVCDLCGDKLFSASTVQEV